MGIHDHVSKLLQTNIDELLDHAENAEAQFEQTASEMESTLRQAAADIAEQLELLREMRRTSDNAQLEAEGWERLAELAASKDAADVAVERLAQAEACRTRGKSYQQAFEDQLHAVTEMTTRRDTLRNKYHDIVYSRDVLLARASSSRMRQMAYA